VLSLHKHIILIGFKHTGKSVIGMKLAKKLQIPFMEVDQQLEYLYEDKYAKKSTCREIMHEHGEVFFRALETESLMTIINLYPSVISFGGGTPLSIKNQHLIKNHILVHITASRNIVFERILKSGRPAFFNPEESLLQFFNRLWDKRITVYEKLAHFSVENNSTIDISVDSIIKKIIARKKYLEKNTVNARP